MDILRICFFKDLSALQLVNAQEQDIMKSITQGPLPSPEDQAVVGGEF